ncbi:unnamed protein product [Meganyctiphanes norvegica]|uniref:G-protein coupled receptors family 2 profile 2 domain-containing protein n=1 Tax=Meganyctiphanes norvegica TaxID=48144 RepID=A0AAV2Q6E6_MEGNR
MCLSTGSCREWIIVFGAVVVVVVLQSGIVEAVDDDYHDPQQVKDANQGTDPPLPEGEALAAINQTCDTPLCVRKCCEDGQHFDNDYYCVPSDNSQWRPTLLLKGRKDADPSKLQVIVGFPPFCAEEDLIISNGSFRLLPNGRIQPWSEEHDWTEDSSSYCLDHIQDVETVTAVHCIGPEPKRREICQFHKVLYPILMSFSSFFLIVTLAVYAGVPNLRQRTYGRCLISLVIALLIFYIMQTSNFIRSVNDNFQCLALAFLMHWNGLAIFFWLNVMAFELWVTVRSQTQVQHTMRRFMKYSAYAWGCPLLFAIITIIIEHLPKEAVIPIFRPKLAGTHCFLEGDTERWIYLNWVILIVTLVNLGFFIDICVRIHKVKAMVNKRTNNFWMFLKMFLIVGISWVIDIFSGSGCYWVIGDLPNLLQGVCIFVATVCNKSALTEIVDFLSPRFRGVGEFWQDVRQKISTSSCAAPSTTATGTRATGLIGNSSADYGSSQDNLGSIPLTDMSIDK